MDPLYLMQKVLLVLIVAATVCAGWAWETQLSFGLGSVNTHFLNAFLEATAERERAEYRPLQWAWRVDLALWVQYLGLSLYFVTSSGGVEGRTGQSLRASLLGAGISARWNFRVLYLPLKLNLALSSHWGWTTGLIEGHGVGWGAGIGLEALLSRLFTWETTVRLGYCILKVEALQTPRGVLRPRMGSALDFSGAYFALTLAWTS